MRALEHAGRGLRRVSEHVGHVSVSIFRLRLIVFPVPSSLALVRERRAQRTRGQLDCLG